MKGQEEIRWDLTKEMLQNYHFDFGNEWCSHFRDDPIELGFALSRYKFAAKMCSKNAHILELGCKDGTGASILAEQALSFTGIGLDEDSISAAQRNLKDERFKFICDDFMGKKYGEFDSIVSFGVIEQIAAEFEELYFETVLMNLAPKGVFIIGTPNASIDAKGINPYSQQRLMSCLQKFFHQVLCFGMNDEIVHTASASMSQYLLCIAVLRK